MSLMPSNPLRDVAWEIENLADSEGWDQAPSLYALVETARLRSDEPALARELGLDEDSDEDGYTAVAQDELPADRDFEDFVAEIVWPPQVHGTAAVLERLMLPPEAEAALPDDQTDLLSYVAEHPDRQEVRITVAVTRDGGAHCVLRLRGVDEVAEGPDLVPGLVSMLRQTLTD
ncbi:hypothetical protein CLV56_0841 [Mumia flava]|uniref:Uncharacterized protein n=1 Tax=Mumia flava TaxID=1348852 RepID=A0A0B2BJP7_9ACTN|nr:PPA1309 family protein [Mumia flava]PJJ56630.1 hypothetical protein CLV56_0841 [Mumia flava]